jgi:transcriptional antiterminator NusG
MRHEPVLVKRPQPRFEVNASLTWFVVCAAVRSGKIVVKGLERAGFVPWRPMEVWDKTYPNGRTREIARNALVRYILVGFGAKSREYADEQRKSEFHVLSEVGGVESILTIAGRPFPVRIADLQRLADRLGDDRERLPIRQEFKVGQRVNVGVGAFASFGGIIEETDVSELKAKVAVEIFGGSTPVEVGFADLEAA